MPKPNQRPVSVARTRGKGTYVGEDSTLRNDNVPKELVELLVVLQVREKVSSWQTRFDLRTTHADSEGEVTRDDTLLLVVAAIRKEHVSSPPSSTRPNEKGEPGGVPSELDDLGNEVLEDGSQVDWGKHGHVRKGLEGVSDASRAHLKFPRTCAASNAHGGGSS